MGWIPASPEGWLVLGLFLVVELGAAYWLLRDAPEEAWSSELTVFMFVTFVLTAGLILLGIKKGPPMKWRWGKSKNDNPEEDF